jgi:hypothetical protein
MLTAEELERNPSGLGDTFRVDTVTAKLVAKNR